MRPPHEMKQTTDWMDVALVVRDEVHGTRYLLSAGSVNLTSLPSYMYTSCRGIIVVVHGNDK